MMPFLQGFSAELEKLAIGSSVNRALLQLQMGLAAKLLGTDPRTPIPFSESQLDDAVSKLRLQQRLVEMNRLQFGGPPEEKTAMFGFMSPRMARRIAQNSGFDDRDPSFQNMAEAITGERNLTRMTQYQLRTLVSVLAGKAV